jgi:hypothetical protein
MEDPQREGGGMQGSVIARWWLQRLAVLSLGLGAVPGTLAALLAAEADSWDGRLFGLGGVLLVAGLTLGLLGGFARRPAARTVRHAAAAVGLLGFVLVARGGPTPGSRAGAIESHWLGEARPLRWSSAVRVPERDQFALGTRLVFLDPVVDGPQVRRIRRLFEAVYAEGATIDGFR